MFDGYLITESSEFKAGQARIDELFDEWTKEMRKRNIRSGILFVVGLFLAIVPLKINGAWSLVGTGMCALALIYILLGKRVYDRIEREIDDISTRIYR